MLGGLLGSPWSMSVISWGAGRVGDANDLVIAVGRKFSEWRRKTHGSLPPSAARTARATSALFADDADTGTPDASPGRGRKSSTGAGDAKPPSAKVSVADVEVRPRVVRRPDRPLPTSSVEATPRRSMVRTPDTAQGPHVAPARESFDNFVWDRRNAIVFRAVRDTAINPTRLCPVLFLYGERGMGKTHLLRACRHELISRGSRPRYLSAEQLTTLFTLACTERTVDELFARLKDDDVLMIDEFHRLGLRGGTRGFAERLISHYMDSGRMVIVAGRHHPHAIYGLGDRQISRLMSGFVARLEPPEAATRERWLRAIHREVTSQDPPREVHTLLFSKS